MARVLPMLTLAAVLAQAVKLKPRQEHEPGRKRRTIGNTLEKLFHDPEEETTPAPTWNGLPLYYEGRLPPNYFVMTHMERQDYFFRMERWHEKVVEQQNLGRCRSPKPGEKVVYFVQHGDAVAKTDDAPIWEMGITQAKNFRYDPLMSKAISHDPKHRAQMVIVSPARKALQTAVIGFGDLLPEAVWEVDPDIRGFGWVEGTLVPDLGAAALYELSSNKSMSQAAVTLLTQYRDMPGGWEKATKPHKDRWFDFVEHLMERPEERIIIVTHSGMIKQANVTKTHFGEITMRALLPDKTWRKLSPPDCWPAEL